MHSRLQSWLECYVWNSSIPLINWEAVTADLKSCGGKIHLMQRWMAGHTTTKALSHSYEAYLITVLQRAIRLCLSLLPIFVSLPLCLTLSLKAKLHTVEALCTTSGVAATLAITAAQCGVQKCRIIPLSGLFQHISDLRRGCHWQWTKKNGGEMMMGTDLSGNWQDWVIDNTTEQ